MAYTKDYFVDRKFKYEKNHGKFIHEFMFTEHEGRILGQCNVALNDLQKQLDAEIVRAKAEEARLDKKIDAETVRAKAEEVRLDGKIDTETSRAKAEEAQLDKKVEDETKRAIAEEALLDGQINTEITRAKEKEGELSTSVSACLPKAGGDMNDTSLINWAHDPNNHNAAPFTLGGLIWQGATDYVSIKGKITGDDNMNLVFNMGDDDSNSITFNNANDEQVASIDATGLYTGKIDWTHINNRPEMDKQALDDLKLNLSTLREAYMRLKARVDKLDGGATE